MKSNWNTSEAYDLSMYETVAAPVRTPQPVPPAPKKRRDPAVAQRAAVRNLLTCAVLLVAFLAMVLYHNVSVVELGDEIQTQRDNLVELENEYSYLYGKLTARTITETGGYAATHGLCKVQNYQVTYIRLSESDQVVRTENAPTGSFLESIMDRMDTVLEYMRIK